MPAKLRLHYKFHTSAREQQNTLFSQLLSKQCIRVGCCLCIEAGGRHVPRRFQWEKLRLRRLLRLGLACLVLNSSSQRHRCFFVFCVGSGFGIIVSRWTLLFLPCGKRILKNWRVQKTKRILAGPTGVEPATLGLKVRCSSLTELRTRKDSLRLIGKHEGVF